VPLVRLRIEPHAQRFLERDTCPLEPDVVRIEGRGVMDNDAKGAFLRVG
jgi:hypothetical protein